MHQQVLVILMRQRMDRVFLPAALARLLGQDARVVEHVIIAFVNVSREAYGY